MNRTALVLVSSCLLTMLLFHEVALGGQIFADRDMLLAYLPMFRFWAEQVREGGYPQWYPFDGLGMPFVGYVLTSAFHPSKLLFLLMDAGAALKVSTLACFPLAAAGVFQLCRSLRLEDRAAAFGALIYAFSGYAASLTNNFPYLMALATMPWAFWFTARLAEKHSFPRMFLAAAGYSLILFAGETQSFVLSCAGGTAIPFLVQSEHGGEASKGKARQLVSQFAWYCGAMALAAAMTCVQWIPSLEMMTQASVGGAGDETTAMAWSLPPLRLLEIAFGGLNGSGYLAEKVFSQDIYGYSFGSFWTRSVVMGVPAIALAVIGTLKRDRVRIFLAVISVISLICAMGSHVGLYGVLHRFPLLSPFRYPEKLLGMWLLTTAILSAYGLHDLLTGPKAKASQIAVLVVGVLAVLAFCLGEQFFRLWSDVAAGDAPEGNWRWTAAEDVRSQCLACQWTLLAGMAAAGICLAKGRRFLFPVLAVTCAVFFFLGTRGTYHPADPDFASRPMGALQLAQSQATMDPPRIARISDHLDTSVVLRRPELENDLERLHAMLLFGGMYPGMFGVEMASSYFSGASTRVRRLLSAANGDRSLHFRLAPLFSAEFTAVWGRDYAEMGGGVDSVVFEDRDFGALLVKNDAPMPRAYLARPVCVPDENASFDAVVNGRMDFARDAVVEACPPGLSPTEAAAGEALGTVAMDGRAPTQVAMDVDSLTDGSVLVLTDAYYSGWEATIDGAPAEILPANHAVRGVMVPKGRHRVEFTYRTPGLIPAAAVSLGAVILSLLACLFLQTRRRKGSVAPMEKKEVATA